MKTALDCVPCLVRQGLEAARHVTADVALQDRAVREVLLLLSTFDLQRSPPFVAQQVHRLLRALTGEPDPYLVAKRRSNRVVSDLLPVLRDQVRRAPEPLEVAVRCAIAANAIDLGAVGSLTDDAIAGALLGALEQPLVGDFAGFRQRVAAAGRVLYLADNAGEIAVDRLLIEVLGPERVTVAVRGGPVLNDATLEDAEAVGLRDLVEVIDNGSDAPGTLLDDTSPAFRRRFAAAELVIAKGQGNYESLSDVPGNLAFLLKVKCALVSRLVALPLGAHALILSSAP